MNLEVVEKHPQQAIWEGYRNNLPRYLIGLSRYLQSRTMHTLWDELGYTDLKINYEPFFTLVGNEGCRLTELADWLAISKQSCNRTANQIKKAGYLEDKPDPSDGRAKILVMTERGRQMVAQASEVSLKLEGSFEEELGNNDYTQLLQLIQRIYDSLDMPKLRADIAGASDNQGLLVSLLPRVSDYFYAAVNGGDPGEGTFWIEDVHGQVLSLIGLSGGRIQQIAKIQDVSKQAISAIAKELEHLGYIHQSPDPDDARGVVLMFTDDGLNLLADSVASVALVEDKLSEILGPRDLQLLKQISKQLYGSLHLEEEVFSPQISSLPASVDRDLSLLAGNLKRELGDEAAKTLGQLLIAPQA